MGVVDLPETGKALRMGVTLKLFPRTESSRALAFLLAGLQLLWIPGCNDTLGSGGGSSSGNLVGNLLSQVNLGEQVFQVYRAQVETSPDNATAKLAALDARRSDFVDAVNTIVEPSSVQGVASTLAAMLEMIDDGSLPQITDGLAAAAELLIGANDPNREVLQAMLDLGDSKTVVQVDDLIDFAGRAVNYPETAQVIEALAELIRNTDGVDDNGQPNGERDLVTEITEFLSESMRDAQLAGSGGGLIDDFIDALLVEADIRGNVNFGAPVYVVRADVHNNPAAAVDPNTGTLRLPFVDNDGDLAADVDGAGNPIDSSGQLIDIPPFGGSGSLDAYRRPLNGGGELYYQYFDGKHTLLSLFLQNTAFLLQNNFHEDAFDVLEILLGARNITYDNGTSDPADDYLGYDGNTPLHDFAWGIIELARIPELPQLLSTLSHLLDSDPDRAERLVVGMAVAIDKLQTVSASPGGSPSGSLLDDMIPIFDDIFETPTAGGGSPARAVFDAFHDAHTQSLELPLEIALMMRFREAVRETVPDNDSNDIDEANSIPVDYSKPSWYTENGQLIDNRSDLHQLLDLLARFDSCSLLGSSVAELFLELAADMTPATVSGLITLINNAFGSFLANLICPGSGNDLVALDVLAKSGGLDGLLPLLKAFKDKGEIGLVTHLLATFGLHYESTIRPSEPFAIEVLESGAIEEVLDLLSEATTVQVPGSNDNAADVLADFLAAVIEDDYPVATRNGGAVPTYLHLLMEAGEDVSNMLNGTTASGSLGDLLATLAEPAIERVTNDNGTPNDPSDDFEELKNRSFLPFVAEALAIVSDAVPADNATRQQMLDDAQLAMADAFVSQPFASFIELGEVLQAQSGGSLTPALINLLTPNLNAPDDVFGALIRVVAAGLQSSGDVGALERVMQYLGEVLDPSQGLVIHLVRGLARFLAMDSGQTAISLLRNALNSTSGSAQSPVGILVEIIEQVQAQGSGGSTVTVASMEADVIALIDFIRDDTSGLGSLYDILGNRP